MINITIGMSVYANYCIVAITKFEIDTKILKAASSTWTALGNLQIILNMNIYNFLEKVYTNASTLIIIRKNLMETIRWEQIFN